MLKSYLHITLVPSETLFRKLSERQLAVGEHLINRMSTWRLAARLGGHRTPPPIFPLVKGLLKRLLGSQLLLSHRGTIELIAIKVSVYETAPQVFWVG